MMPLEKRLLLKIKKSSLLQLLTKNLLIFFSDIPYLRTLHLNHNPLQKVEANAFEMIPQLVSLDLSHCEIKRVAAKAFNQIEALEKLYLNSNQIKEIKQKTVDTIRGLSDKFHSNAPTMRRIF